MPELTSFLIRPAREGYPADYLLARLKGRRPFLVTDWLAPPALETPAAPRRRTTARGMTAAQAREKMRQEFRWVYLQMDRGMRKLFAPLFLWSELRTILICLRLCRGGELERAASLAEASLLAQRPLRVLKGAEEPFTGTDALSELLEADSAAIRELGTLYRERKGREYEQRLVALFLVRLTRLPLAPVLGEFLGSLVDLDNLLALAKQLRWKLREPRSFIAGGNIPTERLEQVLKEGSAAALAGLLRPRPDLGELPALPGNLEHLLLCRLTRKLRKLGRDPLGLGSILAYLWECSVEARNAGLMHHAASLGDEALGAELIG